MKSPDWYPVFRAWLIRQPKVFLAAGMAVLLLLTWTLYVPSVFSIQGLRQRRHLLLQELQEARRAMDRIRGGQVRALPTQETLPSVLQWLHEEARVHNVEILSVTPGTEKPEQSSRLMILPVELRLQGGYRSLAEFLGGLKDAAALGAVSVRRISISRQERLLPRLQAQTLIELILKESSHGAP